ncbi:MAG: RidA family protein [Candidatus Doudnabacteria bacterium]
MLPLSSIRNSGQLYFLSGQIGLKDGVLVSEDIKEQLGQTVENIKTILKEVNLTLNNVVSVTTYLIDQSDYTVFNGTYTELFQPPYPTRTTVTVKSLPLNAKVELQIIASKE